MAAVSEWIAREYFESLGFLVRQPTKYQVSARKKEPSEEFDLLIYHPLTEEETLPSKVLWQSQELKKVCRAVVSVRGWHTDRFSSASLKQVPEIFNFTGKRVQREARHMMGEGPIANILCLPDLTVEKKLHQEALDFCREQGVDGVILFKTMLLELCRHVDIKNNYEKSNLLQILRILKNYDLLKGPQMELFGKQKRMSSDKKTVRKKKPVKKDEAEVGEKTVDESGGN